MLGPADAPLLAAFAAVARRGSYSRAADELRLSKSVVSERVRQLEERCGARLLERTTRSVRLTEAGHGALTAAAEVEAALTRLSATLDARQREPSGTLRVTTTNDLGPLLVAPAAARLVATYPRAQVAITSDDALHDLLGDGIDVAVRLGAPRSSSLVVRKLAVLDEPVVAAPGLAERWGHVTRPRELSEAPWVRHSLLPARALRFTGPGGATDEVVPTVRAEADTGATVLALLLSGAGVGVFPEHALAEHLAAGRLVQLCPGWVWKRVHLFALTPSRVGPRSLAGLFLAMVRDQLALDRARWRTAHDREARRE